MRLAMILLTALLAVHARAAELIVHLDQPAESAEIHATTLGLKERCKVDGKTITCTNLLVDSPYDLAVTLKDGTVLQGVDMNWYAPLEPAADPPAALTEEDRAEIQALIKDVPSFYDRSTLLHLQGDAARAVALVELVRDRAFYDSKGNVVWRVELWYFEQLHGGWAKVQQQNKVLRRERFKSVDAFKQATRNLQWVPALGGIRMMREDQRLELTVPASKAKAAGS